MAKQGESRLSHWLSWRHEEDPERKMLYAGMGFDEQWNKVTQLYRANNESEVREFLSKKPNSKIIDYLIKVYRVILDIFHPDALLLELFQDPEIVENRHLVAWIGVHLSDRFEILEFPGTQDIRISAPFDEVGKRLDTLIEWWLDTVPGELLDIVYFDFFDVSDAKRFGG
jgi:hypothetical protein